MAVPSPSPLGSLCRGALQIPLAAPIAASQINSTKSLNIQAIALELDKSTLDDLVKACSHPGRAPQLVFGRSISLQYGLKSRPLEANPVPHASFVCRITQDEKLSLNARLSHKLVMSQAQKSFDGVDSALAELQNSLASAKQAKAAQQIKFLPDNAGLKPSHKEANGKLRTQLTKSSSSPRHCLSGRRHEVDTSGQVATLSTPTARPNIVAGNSHQQELIKSRAIRRAMIHLLAIAPQSLSAIAQTIRCSSADVEDVLARIAKPHRSDESKWELSDRSYKDLDPWAFPYKKATDREAAIDRAISAFDRSRISAGESLWQILLPAADRGKGRTLSRLGKLRDGPIQQNNGLKLPPRVSSSPPHPGDDNRRSRGLSPHPSARNPSRSRSRDPTASKSTDPGTGRVQKTTNAVKSTSVNREQGSRDKSKKGNILSAERIDDSDEDSSDFKPKSAQRSAVEPPNLGVSVKPPSSSTSHQTSSVLGKASSESASRSSSPVRVITKSLPPLRKEASGMQRESEESQRSRSMSSPHKPSPLGLSPPTNATDQQEDHGTSSSASSTPLLQACKDRNKVIDRTDRIGSIKSVTLGKRSAGSLHEDTTTLKRLRMLPKAAIRIKPSPPTSESPSPPSVQAVRAAAMEKAQRFKDLYPMYEQLHRRMQTRPDPDQIHKLERLRKKLGGLKQGIQADCQQLHRL